MKSVVLKLASYLALLSLAACGGGGGSVGGGVPGGGSSGGSPPSYSHEYLASQFVTRMNMDAGYDLDLVKANTLQYDYIVVYDYDYGTYDAYYIGNYLPGDDLFDYLDMNDYSFYYDLIPIGYNEFEDPLSGLIFEKTKATKKDRLKMAALEETLTIKKGAETLNAQFGLSQERSFEVAKLAAIWQKTPKERMTDEDHDQFAADILGHTISEYKAAVEKKMSGQGEDLKALIASTAEMNGVSPEQMNEVIGGVFGLDLK